MTESAQSPYDLLVVGAGMYGSCFARLASDLGKRVLLIDRRDHVGGNCYTETRDGIHIHRYGPHIFHTSSRSVWDFVNRFASFNAFINSPLAISRGELFSLPFNMYTFRQLWGVLTPEQARAKLRQQCVDFGRPPENLEEQALALLGPDIYERLIRGYTMKQWQKDPRELPAEIIRRTPLRFTATTTMTSIKVFPSRAIPNYFTTCLAAWMCGLGLTSLPTALTGRARPRLLYIQVELMSSLAMKWAT